MLLGNFFTIQSIQASGDAINARLEINPFHSIFDGHFPGIPVVPGVCMLQIVKEITESVIGRTTRLVKSDQVKFLSVNDPRINPIIQAALKYKMDETGKIQVVRSLLNAETVCLKYNRHYLTVHYLIAEAAFDLTFNQHGRDIQRKKV
jgi:3-hydroxyacyl-[acyl-carrier-protein] dehydratase